MAGREYSVVFEAAVTAAVDLFEIAPGDDKPIVLHAVYIGQTTEIGDAMEEMIEVEIHRGGTGMTTGTGGNQDVASTPLNPGDAADSATVDTMNTGLATFTAGVVMHKDAFNVRTGWQYLPPPEDRIAVHQANGGLVIRLPNAPTDSITYVGTVVYEEIG